MNDVISFPDRKVRTDTTDYGFVYNNYNQKFNFCCNF
jgi:hypothetical protein